MKKLLCVFLILLFFAAGLFLWKGGHHAIALTQLVEDYLDIDEATQSVSVQVQIPDAESGHVVQYRMDFETFVTEHADRLVLGLTAEGISAYTDGHVLYMDTGKAYALPELSGFQKYVRNMAAGLLLKGRITKHGDIYTVSMVHDGLKLNADLTADSALRAATATVVLSNDTSFTISITATAPASHPIPRPVLDAMVRAKMEPPMPLTEPLQMLLPALDNLLPLQGDLTLGVECGILNLSETAVLCMDHETARLERNGVTAELDLPDGLSGANPAALSLVLLRNGSFTHEGNTGRFDLNLSADTTNALCTALVPQLDNLGISFTQSHAAVTIAEGRLTSVTMTAEGEVPFLITTIPITFCAELLIP